MGEYLSPGVYVEEYDNSPRAMQGVGTSIAGFVGMAEKGPAIGAPSMVTNFAAFNKQFGGALSEFSHGEYRYLSASVEQFFANGGTTCFISRVIPPDAKKAEIKSGLIKITAANQGKWGNRIRVSVQSVMRKKMQIIARSEENDAVYAAKSADGFREGALVSVNNEYNRIVSIFGNTVTFEQPFASNVVDTGLVPSVVIYLVEMDLTVQYNDETEEYPSLSFNIVSPDYIGFRLERSELVDIEVEELKDIANPAEKIFGEGVLKGVLTLEGGDDGSISKVSAETFIGIDKGPGKRTGIQSFLENNMVSMMAVPGITIPEVAVSLVSHCENLGSRFAVIDMPKDTSKPDELISYRSIIDSTYAAMYHPWLQVFDRNTKKPGFVPPSGSVLGVYSRTDINRGVHKAPANETVSCTGLRINYTKGEQDILNPEGVNLIRSIQGNGIRIWGARTAGSNASFRYINVRRLFIFVEESIKANTGWVVFEPNDAALWSRVDMTISSFLDGLYRNGMLAGGSPEESYFVEIGPSTMTQDDIRSGRLICNVGIAPSRPAEFVIFRVTQHTAEASGGN